MFHPHLIMHPADFSNPSNYAFQIAVDLAQQNKATLLILHVVETLGPENITFGEAGSQLEPEGYGHRLEANLKRLTPPADSGVPTQYLVVEGDPAQQIVRVARERHCDLIVLGTHGHTGLTRLLMGSIAEKVVRLAPCPVLTTKLPAGAASAAGN